MKPAPKKNKLPAATSGDVSVGEPGTEGIAVGKPAFRYSQAENLAVVGVTGACVMVIEVLGTRVIGPAFGVSLFVWSALLAVTLGSLAAGYYLGGVTADRRPSAVTLNAAVLLAGLALGWAPLLRKVVLTAAANLGPRMGPIVSAAVLFGPALMILGAVGPISARLAASDVGHSGRRVGSIFAVSTAGSLVGTMLVAYWLIPSFETDTILTATATLLGLLGAIPLALRWRRWSAVASALPLIVASMCTTTVPSGFSIVESTQSLYGLVEVIDDLERKVRFLRVDHSVIGADLMPERTSAFTFVYLLELVKVMRAEAHSMLQIGLGTGSLPRSLAGQGLTTDVVEIDPAVVDLARKHFDFVSSGQVFTEDARTFLNTTSNKYDIVVHDTFTGGSTPEHLLSREVLARIRAILVPGGLLALNFVGAPKGEATQLVANTVISEFRYVRAFMDDAGAGLTNIVFFASDKDLQLDKVAQLRFRPAVRETSRRTLFDRELPITRTSHAQVVTDGHNPLNRLELPIAEDHGAAMNELLPIAVWIR